MLVHPGPTVKRTPGPLLLPFVMFIVTIVILAIAAFLYFAISAEAASSGRPDVSGVWIFNPADSKLQVPPPASMTFRIEQSASDALFVRTRTLGNETDTWQLKISMDGSEAIQERGLMKTHYRVYWRGETLVLDSISVGNEYSATNVVEYTLSEDGKRLTAVEHFKGPQLKYENIWVFDRK